MNEERTLVTNCNAGNCRFNNSGACHAGQVEISFSGTQATCATFAPAGEQGATIGDSAQQ